MAKSVGVVSKVVGQVFAVGSDGSQRLLIEGDRLYAGEQLQTGVAGAVAVRLDNGAELTLGRDSSLVMTHELLANQPAHVQTQDVAPSQAQLSDVERIQRAIAAGDDPSVSTEAPAAGNGGNGAPGALGGGHSFVMLTEVADRVDPVVGFPTAGFNGIPELANRYVGDEFGADNAGNAGLPPSPPEQPNPPVTPIDEDRPVELSGLNVSPGELTLDEASLPLGSASDPAALTQQGSFTVLAPDGVYNLSVGGINVVTAGVVTGVGQSITTGLGNTLTITGYNPATGVVSYSYTLSGAEQHVDGAGNNSQSEHLPVLVSDSDGDVAQGSLDVVIRDDVPQAVDDSNTVAATEQHTELTGNVLGNDIQGADRVPGGPVIAGTFTGTYGTLVLAADGSYTYTLNTSDPDFKNLGGGGQGVESFNYTIKDADGDTSSATLTLNVTNLNDPVLLDGLGVQGGELTVYEKNLQDGSAPDAGALTQQGTFKVTAPDGLQSLSVGGISVISGGVVAGFPQSIVTPEGNTLTVTGYDPATGVVSYSYTLTGTEQHADGAGSNSLSEHFQVVAKDVDGSTATGSLDVTIRDDVPQAVDDSNAVAATEQHTALTGNVLGNDIQGADRVPGGPVIAGTFTGTYGTLVLAADGSYTYTLNTSDPDFKNLGGGGQGVESFNYTIKDADGDTSSATLTLNVTNLNDPVSLDGLGVQGGELTVYEKNLQDGSAPDAGALTQQGTFKITAPDGLQSLSVGGISVVSGGVVTGFPQSIVTPEGNTLTVTGYDPATGVVSYSYTLTGTEQHADGAGSNSLSEHFQVVAKDVDGSTATGSLDVTIRDDVPQAVDDSNAVAATEQHTALTGNVLGNDIQGADRVPGGPVIAGTFTGTYGTLVLAADGSYTYTLNTSDPDFKNLGGGGQGVESFNYTIKDADGDTSSATLTLNVTNLNDPVSLDGLGVQGGELTVYEKNLQDGSAPDAGALTQQGTFKITAPDGLQSLSVGGISVVSGGVVTGFPQSIVTPEGNTLTVTGYDPATGVVSYSYTLTGTEQHADGAGSNSLSEHFQVVAKDVDGSTATGSLDVTIRDDVPQAVDDSNAVAATEQHTALTGNVLGNDIQGADRVPGGPVIAGTFTGTYGTLVLAADGSYTYTLNTSDPDFKNLGGGGQGVESFNYTIKDADGDTSSATLTLNVTNLNDPVSLDGLGVQGGELTVYEKNLQDGSAPDAGALTQQGTFKVTAPDGLQSLSVGGISVVSGGVVAGFPQSIVTSEGNTLTVTGYDPATGVVSYSYTLTEAEQHADGAGSNSLSEHFQVIAKDVDGSTATGSLDVNIIDDLPQAHDDHAAVDKGGVVYGNVMYNDVVGADTRGDGQHVVGVRAGSDTSTSAIGQLNTQVNGQYGYLIIDAQGNAEYHSNPSVVSPRDAVDTFVYTIRDADGDESTTTITVNVHNSLMACEDRDITVYEKALDLQRDGNDLAAGNVTGSDPGSSQETTSGTLVGSASGGVGALTYTLVGNAVGQYGQIQLNADGSYTYTLTSPANSPNPANDGANTVTETFTYQVQDSLGNSTTSTIVITVVDDVPTANSDFVSVFKGDVVRGNVMYNDVVGADTRGDGQYVVGVRAGSDTSSSAIGQLNTQVNGQYGYLTIDAYGNAEYHSNPAIASSRDAIDTFVYTIRDADGDESTTTLTVNVHNGLIVCADRDVTVYENALDLHKDGSDLAAGTVTGSNPGSTHETASGTLTVGGVGALTFTLVGNAVGQYGQIQLNADGSYTYTLTSPANSPTHANDGANAVTETFTYQVQDSLGNSAINTIVITIVDDVPTANSDFVSVDKGDVVRGNVMYNDVVGADTRGDGQYVVGVRAGSDTSTSAIGQLNTQVNGQFGYLTIDAYGNAEYHSNPNVASPRDAVDTFVYTVRDADGDESTTTLTINVHSALMTCEDRDVTVYEKALDLQKDGNDLAAGTVTGSDPGSPQETAAGTLAGSTSGGVGALTYTLVGNAVGQYGQIHLNADGSYTYTLTSPANSPTHANDGANTLTESFTYQVQDSAGHSTTSTIVITIVDDVPTANSDFVSVYKGDVVSGNVMYNDVVGADTRGDGQYVVGVRAGSDTSTSAIGQLNSQVHGQYGYLTIDAQGNAQYHSNPDAVAPRDALDTFVYTIRDGDGDESTTTLTINVHNPALQPCGDGGVWVYENALDLYKDGNDLAAGSVTGSDPSSTRETASGSLVGQVAGGVGALTYTLVGNAVGQFGQLHLNADGSYTYTLTSPANSPTHANDGANTVSESFTYRVEDTVGNWTTSTVKITVVDDVPQAHCDFVSVAKGDIVRGNVMYNDVVGADTLGDGAYVVGVRAGHDTSSSAVGQLGSHVYGQYGYLTLDAQGNAEYHANPNAVAPRDAIDTFVYTLRDGDGDESTATVTINVHDKSLHPCGDGGVTVFEKALDLNKDGHDLAAGSVNGSDPGSPAETASGSLVGQVGGGVGALTYTLIGHAVGQYGQIHLNADGSYTYTLTSPANSQPHANDGATTVSESFTYRVEDTVGNWTTSTVNITIVDDVPQAHCDTVSVSKGDEVRGNVLYNDAIGADLPADCGYVVGVRAGHDTSTSAIGQLGSHVAGQFGYLTLDAQGNAVYHADPNVAAPRDAIDTFVYTLRDGDGDESTATITINVHDSSMSECADGYGRAQGQRVIDRGAFTLDASSMTAALVVLGYLGATGAAAAQGNAEEVINVSLRKGETLQLDHDQHGGNLALQWKDAGGSYQPIDAGGSFTASHDGVYSIHASDPTGAGKAGESYKLSLVVDYAQAAAPHINGGTEHSAAGLSSPVDIASLQAPAPAGDEHDGHTANYAQAKAAVTIDLSHEGAQDTGGAGVETLNGIHNLVGSDYGDTLIGNSADNVLDGGAGNDVLKGGGGNDILIGGPGNDSMTGGNGNDTFVWHKGDTGHDTVTDFTPGSDKLDLSQLLQGEHGTAASLDDYLHFKVSGTGADVVSTIEVSSVAGAAPVQTIDLAGVDLAQHYGVSAGAGGVVSAGHDTATIINGMLDDHSLKVDTV
ncbi:retention module-containing protein [Pseudomonas putida]|uniref:retention module-containing protein n=1 Tax=Pseudomonas putida TaxID=303 RepID=UPI002271C6E7|nr:retention module-containing protein [Pseudomonas putida]WAB96801.1 retention module-containing protein [Pseudomonas putida]